MKAYRMYKKGVVIALLGLALVPIVITFWKVISTEQQSVVFLEGYNQNITFLVIAYYVILIGIGLYWLIRQLIYVTKLKSEKLQVESLFLQSQVSPHFFFNMLNNLYGLVDKDSAKAQKLILKLSDMMRYSIYDGQKDRVSLKEEVDYLKNYIELHRMRYHKKIHIDAQFDSNEGTRVAPLLFIILLENAFKHGIENLREDARVVIRLTDSERKVDFTIENNFEPSQVSENDSGIGLKNLKRRLELIYPNKHTLLLSTSTAIFRAQLTLLKE